MLRIIEQELNNNLVTCRIDADYAYLISLSDLHVGSVHHNEKQLDFVIDTIKKNPYIRVIVGGDATEGAGIHTVSSVFEEKTHGIDQVLKLRDKLKPIKDQILFVRTGNHGYERSMKNNKMPPEIILAELLEVPYVKGCGSAMINVRKNCYTVSTWHNSKKPNKFEWIQADIQVFEHLHLQGYERNLVAVPNKFSKKWTVRDTLNIQAGSFLSWGGYAADRGYRVLKTGCPVIELSGLKDKWGMTVFEDVNDFIRFVVNK